MIHNNIKSEIEMIENRIVITQKGEEEHYRYLFNEIAKLKERIKKLEEGENK